MARRKSSRSKKGKKPPGTNLQARPRLDTPAQQTPQRRQARTWPKPLLYLALLLWTGAVYWPSLGNGFTFDDDMVIKDAAYLLSQPKLESLLSHNYFTLSGESTYRPVTTLTYIVDWHLGGGQPLVFHLHSLLWHLLAAALFLTLLLRLKIYTPLALLGSALFAVHPALVEAVDNISFREDPLAAALGLAALLLLGRSPGGHLKLGWLAGGCLLFLAQLAKESAFVFVLLAPVTIWITQNQKRTAPQSLPAFIRQNRVQLASILGATGAFLVLRFWIFPASGNYGLYPGGSLATGIGSGLMAAAYYLRLFALPTPLCADYRGVIAPVTHSGDWRLWLSLLVLTCTVALAFWLWRRCRLASFGLLWFALALGPVLNLIPIPIFMAERFLYIPYMGLVLALCAALRHIGQRWVQPPIGQYGTHGLLAAMLLIFAVLTWQRHQAWNSNQSLWSTTLADHPTSYGARHGLAVALQKKGQLKQSVELLQQALKNQTMSQEERARILGDLGISLGRQDLLEPAVEAFVKSLQLRPDHKSHYNLGITLLRMGRPAQAETELRQSIALTPHYALPYLPLAELAERRGDIHGAQKLRQQAKQLGL